MADSYVVELSDELAPLIGRLVVGSSYRDRATHCKLENYFNVFLLTEILRTPFEGRIFPGLSEISLPFHELESIVHRNRADWRGPLSSINGVYVLNDAETGGLYVGSAYGSGGVWSRWSGYVHTGHGNNELPRRLFGENPVSYARRHITVSLLEAMLPSTTKDDVIARERYWKQVLGSRHELHLNLN